jgi:hypothetical protein
MHDTDGSLALTVAADPAAPAVVHGELRRWLARVGVHGWVVDDLLAASDEICFETILVAHVTRIEVRAELVGDVIHLDVTSDRHRDRLRLVPTHSGIEVIDEIADEIGLVRQVADTVAIRALPDRTIVELTKILG